MTGLTIEEARARLNDAIPWAVRGRVDVRPEDIRLLLASEASAQDRLKEAVRLMESAQAMLRHTHDRLLSHYAEFDMLCVSINGECRALAAFLAQEKEAGRG